MGMISDLCFLFVEEGTDAYLAVVTEYARYHLPKIAGSTNHYLHNSLEL